LDRSGLGEERRALSGVSGGGAACLREIRRPLPGPQAKEGSSRERNVIVEFDDYATAVACYESPEYQAAKTIRNAHSAADFVIVEGA
jgi:hypothetical protein